MKPSTKAFLNKLNSMWGNPFTSDDAKRLAAIKKWNDEVDAKNDDKKALQKSRKDARNQAKNGLKRSN